MLRCLSYVVLLLPCVAAGQQAENTTPLADGLEPLSVRHTPVELPRVRLTPPVTAVDGLDAFTLDLSGEWRFAHKRPVPFTGKADEVEAWDTVELPGHFAFQGHERLGPELGRAVAYRKAFDVPAEWADHAVVLRFGSIDGLAKVWVNERPVGSSDSAFLPVEFDVSPYMIPGEENQIAVSLEVSDLTAWYLRELGGMGRPATLTALPKTHVSRMHVVTAEPTGDGRGLVHARATVTNVGSRPTPAGGALAVSIASDEGEPLAELVQDLPEIAPGQEHENSFRFQAPDIQPWTNESPTLYRLEARLTSPDHSGMTVARPFGFRSIEIDGHRLLVNGRPVQLAGANYHLTHPGYGHFVPGPLIRRDLEILKHANLNALRAWPTPYREYVDACNELGLFTTVEVPVNLQLYAPGPRKDHGNNPALSRPYLELAARVVETYRSDPSVLMWGLANESIYYDYFQRAAVAMHRADPTRPVFFGGDLRMGVDIPGVQVNDEHYPRGGVTTWDDPGDIQPAPTEKPPFGWHFPTDRPAISSEWLHLNINNRAQLLMDPGVDDFWGLYAKAHQDWTWRTPHFVGGFTFLAAPYRDLKTRTRWRGFFDDHRRPTPYIWHIHKASSPVQLDRDSLTWKFSPDPTHVRFTLTNRFNFTNLDRLRFVAAQGDKSWAVDVAAEPHQQTAEIVLPWDTDGPDLILTATWPDGREVDRFVIADAPRFLPKPDVSSTARVADDSTDRELIVDTGRVRWHLDRETGLIHQLESRGQAVDVAGPRLTVRGHGHPNPDGTYPNIAELCRGWQLEKLEVLRDKGPVVVAATGRSNHAAGTLTMTFYSSRLQIDYDFEWTWDLEGPFSLFDRGVAFTLPPAYDTLVWSRDALWTAYPDDHIGRSHGRAPARGEPRWAELRDAADPDATPTWPWSQDLTGPPASDGQVTRDFRATRIHFHHGGLIDAAGAGFFAVAENNSALFAEPPQYLRALPAADTAGLDAPEGSFTLQVNDYFEGGSDFHSTKSLYVERRTLRKGDRLTGSSTWRWIEPD
ncbi:MAG: glycoside hydrolase family 2 TIM barrel-domain containing protein [Planctomycetota bacterium]